MDLTAIRNVLSSKDSSISQIEDALLELMTIRFMSPPCLFTFIS